MSTPVPEVPDLDACAREPIHIPGSIQPHGILLVIDPADGRVIQASANAATALLGGEGEVLGQPWNALLHPDPAQAASLQPVREPLHLLHAPCRLAASGEQRWKAAWHLYPERWLVELEPARGEQSLALGDALRAQREIDRAPDVTEAARRAAAEIRALAGYDRVMVYRFDEEWHGDVIAEVRRPGLESYLGLHYPATDIPAQARALYLRSRIRQIVDVGYTPVPVRPTLDPRDGQPLDLSDCGLRSVSPVHCEYLSNMGVAATLVVSLVVNDRLWGLIACHHYQTRFVDHVVRDACEAVALALAARVGSLEAITRSEAELSLLTVREKLITAFSEAEGFTPGLLTDMAGDLLDVVDADGVAVFHGEQLSRLGRTPDEAGLRRIRAALEESAGVRRETDHAGLLHLSEIGRMFPELADLAPDAAGLIYVPLQPKARSALLWTRREQVRTVNWAGNPQLSKLEILPGRLSPRKSFELWQDTVRGRSRAWSPLHLESARSLRVLIELMERKRDRQDLVLLEATLARMRHGVAIIERTGEPPRSRLVFVNPAFARASGTLSSAALGMPLRDLDPALAAAIDGSDLEGRLSKGESLRELLPLRGEDGRRTPWAFEFEPLPEAGAHWLVQLRPAGEP
ncbi:putative PAS/PAC sensor protein [Pseudoxanthomonas suwonensis 11-1]|uniref:Putative PAS/PAC sensor protein n=1 Tax=Pseudoxanthomonas suwonensis (strain 11-1) TaxID=743721 RepID=E6WXH5_PSEUU|nr:bacteriophytochrome BphP [Pseudoxanthomonas suwonensis]ADV28841.1 putative PAS/PAC sensor protein [Pseudoxanthomonas suwonensis 11-1]